MASKRRRSCTKQEEEEKEKLFTKRVVRAMYDADRDDTTRVLTMLGGKYEELLHEIQADGDDFGHALDQMYEKDATALTRALTTLIGKHSALARSITSKRHRRRP